jgi:Ca2+-binding EF-hand superfamily protein
MRIEYASDSFIFHDLMSVYGYSFPANIIIHIIQLLNDDSEILLSLQKFSESFGKCLQHKQKLKSTQKHMMTHLILNGDCWCAYIYIIAGLLLMVGVFLKKIISTECQRNIFLMASISYGVCSGRGFIKSVICKWRQIKTNKQLMTELRNAFMMKVEENKGAILSTPTDDGHSYDEIMCHAYSVDVNVRYGTRGAISLTQLNHLILEETDCFLTFEELKHVFTLLDCKGDGKITTEEFFLFLTNDLRVNNTNGHVQNVIFHLMSDRILISTAVFLLGSSLSALNNILRRFNDVAAISAGSLSLPFFISSCFVLGTLGFTLNDYRQQHDLFSLRTKIKQILLCWFKTEKYNEKDDTKRNNNTSNTNGLTRKNFRLLLDDSNVFISDQLFLAILGTITASKENNYIPETDINKFISTHSNQFFEVCAGCFTNSLFLANCLWFFGAIGFLMSSCVEINTVWYDVGEKVSQLLIILKKCCRFLSNLTLLPFR